MALLVPITHAPSLEWLAIQALVQKKFLEEDAANNKNLLKACAEYLAEAEPGVLYSITTRTRLTTAVAQCYLREKGCDVGKIDGYNGPATQYALEQYKKTVDYFRDLPLQSPVWPLEKDVPDYYGEKGKHQVKVKCPYPLLIAWNNAQSVDEITLHEKVADSASKALEAILKEYGNEKIIAFGLNQFGGSLNVRLKRGSTTQWSMHSWGIAIDWCPQFNQLKWGMDRATLAKPECKPFWEIWEAQGWVSLGRQRNYDWMHVQAARLP